MCSENGFLISLPEGYKLEESLRRKFGIGEDLRFDMNYDVDRIQRVVGFCEELWYPNGR